MNEPLSILTRERPDIWNRAINIASSLTGYTYAPKLPLADGTIYACGEYHSPKPSIDREIEYLEKTIDNMVRHPTIYESPGFDVQHEIDKLKRELAQLKKKRDESLLGVVVPDGAMEWLLHEVGHWVAASSKERALSNYGLTASEYGHDGNREWQAWAFEEIVLAPFGSSRSFAPPSQRDGAAFSKNGPMPLHALSHVERQIRDLGLDVDLWRCVYGDWIRWGRSKGENAPWASTG